MISDRVEWPGWRDLHEHAQGQETLLEFIKMLMRTGGVIERGI